MNNYLLNISLQDLKILANYFSINLNLPIDEFFNKISSKLIGENTKRSQMNSPPTNDFFYNDLTLYDIAFQFKSYKDITNYCLINKKFNEIVCRHDTFWIQAIKNIFGVDY